MRDQGGTTLKLGKLMKAQRSQIRQPGFIKFPQALQTLATRGFGAMQTAQTAASRLITSGRATLTRWEATARKAMAESRPLLVSTEPQQSLANFSLPLVLQLIPLAQAGPEGNLGDWCAVAIASAGLFSAFLVGNGLSFDGGEKYEQEQKKQFILDKHRLTLEVDAFRKVMDIPPHCWGFQDPKFVIECLAEKDRISLEREALLQEIKNVQEESQFEPLRARLRALCERWETCAAKYKKGEQDLKVTKAISQIKDMARDTSLLISRNHQAWDTYCKSGTQEAEDDVKLINDLLKMAEGIDALNGPNASEEDAKKILNINDKYLHFFYGPHKSLDNGWDTDGWGHSWFTIYSYVEKKIIPAGEGIIRI